MSSYASHIVKRNNTYHFRLAIPRELRDIYGQTEIRKSLKTQCLDQAKLKAHLLYLQHKQLFTEARDMPKAKSFKLIIRELTHPDGTKETRYEDINTPKDISLYKEAISGETTPPNTSSENSIVTHSKLLTELWNDYRQEKLTTKEWQNNRTTKTRDTWFLEFLKTINGDRPIVEIDRAKAVDALARTRTIPSYWQRRYGDTPLDEIPEDANLISEKSVEDRMTLISGLFKWAAHCDYISKNPFDGLKYQAKSQKSYATYDKDDLELLFNLPSKRINRVWQFWIPRIALFTGARQNEIAQLTVDDIRQFEGQDWYFSINDEDNKTVKSEAAVRYVPIHSTLIENGFLEYYEKVKNEGHLSLWPDLNSKGDSLGQNVSHYWNDILKRRHQLPPEPITADGRRKVFHSLRRVFINDLRDKGQDIVTIQNLVGHEPELLGETKTYLDEITPSKFETLKKSVEAFSPNSNISWKSPPPKPI